ncbi:MAG: type II secretion system protein GspJ [Phycisphaerales bacterium]|nr:type II secretion system protein GspJ [Phycisphaerales bacterium]
MNNEMRMTNGVKKPEARSQKLEEIRKMPSSNVRNVRSSTFGRPRFGYASYEMFLVSGLGGGWLLASSRHSSCVMRHSKAFTLLELILALTLTVGVTAILGSSLYTAFRAKGAIEKAVDAARASSTAADIIAHEIPLALPPSPSNAPSGEVQLPGSNTNLQNGTLIGPFEGTDQTLDYFISGNEPKADLQGDVREVIYLLVPDDTPATSSVTAGTQLLVRRVETNLLQDNPDIPPDEILAKDVLNFTLQYYDGNDWYDAWDSTQQSNRLPLAVQFTIELAPLRPGQPSRIETRTVPLPLATPSSTDTTGLGGLLP